MNGLPAPRRRREHQSPAGSGAARTEASYPSPCLQPCDCPSLSTPQPEHPSEALHLIFITFHYPGKKTMWIVEIFCEERKRQKALDPKLKENQRLEFQLWRKDQKNARSRRLLENRTGCPEAVCDETPSVHPTLDRLTGPLLRAVPLCAAHSLGCVISERSSLLRVYIPAKEINTSINILSSTIAAK
ncbi:hypothetical protein MJT46_007520 [Ovis ammon polii x Ovis aries]|nr:hypothetical protein MJT46_007520 [Ovis ammon polii x Ovis aries]